MTNEELSESLTSHIKQLLDISDELATVTERENTLHSELTSLGKRKTQLQRELKESKKLLEFCIDTRSDPTQTRLSNNDDELKKLLTKSGERETLLEEFDVLSKASHASQLNEAWFKKRFG